jgi:hypothetical protein
VDWLVDLDSVSWYVRERDCDCDCDCDYVTGRAAETDSDSYFGAHCDVRCVRVRVIVSENRILSVGETVKEMGILSDVIIHVVEMASCRANVILERPFRGWNLLRCVNVVVPMLVCLFPSC